MIHIKDYLTILRFYNYPIPPTDHGVKMLAKQILRQHSLCSHVTKRTPNKYARTYVSFKNVELQNKTQYHA